MGKCISKNKTNLDREIEELNMKHLEEKTNFERDEISLWNKSFHVSNIY
jgi:hypothetical protein